MTTTNPSSYTKPLDAMVAPAVDLPPTLVSEIFMHCLSPGPPACVVPDPTQPPLLLCQICSTWRQIALDTPELWARLSFQTLKQRKFDGLVALIETWFARAGVYPLSLGIDSSIYLPSVMPNLLINSVIPYSHRLRSLDLQLPASHFEPFISLPAGSVNVLESISITASVSQSGKLWSEPFRILENAPRLRSVSFNVRSASNGMVPIYDPLAERLPWSQLTDLHILNISVRINFCLDVLERCTNLVNITLVMVRTPPDLIPPRPILLSHLHRLELHEGVVDGAMPMYRSIIAPALKELELVDNQHGMFFKPWRGLREMQSRSAFSLEKLRVSCRPWTPATGGTRGPSDVKPLLEVLPSLRYLQLSFVDCNDESLFKALTYREGDDPMAPCMVPNLERLELADTLTVRIGQAAAEMVESRWWPDQNPDMRGTSPAASLSPSISRLKYFSLVHGLEIGEDSYGRLEKCHREGLQFEFRSFGRRSLAD